MAQKTKRSRRTTLRGWWKTLPYLLFPITVFMTFAYWEAGRLQNEYNRINRVQTIQELKKEIAQLRDHDRTLNRIEAMDEKAPNWQLVEPDPDQIVVVPASIIRETLDSLDTVEASAVQEELPTRAVLLHISYEDEVTEATPTANEPSSTSREHVAYELQDSQD